MKVSAAVSNQRSAAADFTAKAQRTRRVAKKKFFFAILASSRFDFIFLFRKTEFLICGCSRFGEEGLSSVASQQLPFSFFIRKFPI